MENFTPISSLVGGVLIGLSAAALLFFNGKILGVSGIFGGLLHAKHGDTLWRVVFMAGLLFGGLLLGFIAPQTIEANINMPIGMVIIAGLLVGVGARLGNGCTSGHGICGVGRMAPRSLVATIVFLSSGIVTAVLCSGLIKG
jgi:uncharacterized membrane protein YedE/YeeE